MHADGQELPPLLHVCCTPAATDRCVEVTAGKSRRGFGSLRKLPSGRWQASFVGPDLVRRPAPQTFETKGDAEGWLGRRRGEVMAGEWQPPVKVPEVAPLTFDAYAAQWLRERDL